MLYGRVKLFNNFRLNLVDFCIADRAFSSIDSIVNNFGFGSILVLFYKTLWFHKSDNTENFLKANIPKIALCDPNDTLVKDISSLKSSLSLKYLQSIIPNETKSFLKYCLENKNDYENFIEIIKICFYENSDEKNEMIDNYIIKTFENDSDFSREKKILNNNYVKFSIKK